ncbi:MAG: hypothetical protein ACHP6H_06160, partial [Legionellales bacterium]
MLEAQNPAGKKKKKKKHTTAKADTVATVPPPDTAKAVVVAPPDDDTGHQFTKGLVADTSYLAYNDYPRDSSRPVDGFYKIPLLTGAKPFAFPYENKYNIVFYKRIWRDIDLTDSVNKIFAAHDETLISILLKAIQNDKIVAYSDEGFKFRMSYSKVMKSLSDSTSAPDIDTSTGDIIGSHLVFNPFNPDSVAKWQIKEDLYFDKVRGRLITQIIYLAPRTKLKGSKGEVMGEQTPFYLYFPQVRNALAGRQVYDTQRDLNDVSYEDIFVSRKIKSL